jgi:peptide/nickel transport system substrate-binding protein
LKPAVVQGVFNLYFADQWDRNRPGMTRGCARRPSLAIDRNGHQPGADPRPFAGHRQLDRAEGLRILLAAAGAGLRSERRPKKLLAEAGFPNGFDAGDYNCDASYSNIGEAVVDNLLNVGIAPSCGRPSAPPLSKGFSEKEVQKPDPGRTMEPSAMRRPGSRRTSSRAACSLWQLSRYRRTVRPADGRARPRKREAILHKIQQLMVERTIYAPIWQLAFPERHRPRVGESGFGRIPLFPVHRALRGHHDQRADTAVLAARDDIRPRARRDHYAATPKVGETLIRALHLDCAPTTRKRAIGDGGVMAPQAIHPIIAA